IVVPLGLAACEGDVGEADVATAYANGQSPTPIPVALAFTPPSQSFPVETCRPALLTMLDRTGLPAAQAFRETLRINQLPSSLPSYTDSKCSTPASSFTIPTGQASFTFYLKGTSAGTWSIRAQISRMTDGFQKEILTLPPFVGDGPADPPTAAPAQAAV